MFPQHKQLNFHKTSTVLSFDGLSAKSVETLAIFVYSLKNLKSGVYLMQRVQDFGTKIKKAKEGSAIYELLQ